MQYQNGNLGIPFLSSLYIKSPGLSHLDLCEPILCASVEPIYRFTKLQSLEIRLGDPPTTSTQVRSTTSPSWFDHIYWRCWNLYRMAGWSLQIAPGNLLSKSSPCFLQLKTSKSFTNKIDLKEPITFIRLTLWLLFSDWTIWRALLSVMISVC